ncbi:TolC family protein [Desulfobaculum bizertense]|uniref:TolC family protein n=1 Tax=Desulfobaculum bizertense TaxID=376490 RepID=UPI001F2082F1|nr:TolC family protein [Desulfobaculum bizertense]UIJ38314.1 TolC family protein [Desulfobaculum bizertense]
MRTRVQYLFLFSFGVIFLFATQAFCAPPHEKTPPELADLMQYLKTAEEQNNSLRSAQHAWQAEVKKALGEDTLPDPRLSFGYYTTPLETRGGPARYKYGLSQSFPFFGKLSLKKQIAMREADGFKAKLDAVRLQLFYDIKTTYFEYAYLAKAISITKENMELLSYLEKVATTTYSTGATSQANIIKPQLELGKLEDRLASLREQQRPLVEKLNALLNQEPDTPIPFPKEIPVIGLKTENATLIENMRDSNPNLQYWGTVLNKQNSGLKLAEKSYFPDFTFGVEAIEVDDARNDGVTGDGENPVMVSMSLNIPLWQDARDAAVASSQEKIRSTRQKQLGLERLLRSELELTLYQYRDAERKVSLYRDSLIPKAEQNFSVNMEAFINGSGSSLDLIDSERTLLEMQLAYYRSLANQAQRFAKLEVLVGHELTGSYSRSSLKQPQAHNE